MLLFFLNDLLQSLQRRSGKVFKSGYDFQYTYETEVTVSVLETPVEAKGLHQNSKDPGVNQKPIN